MVSDKADFTLWDVSIPAAAGKIHLGRLFQGPPGLRFQFPQLRVRYIVEDVLEHRFRPFQFPQLRVRYIIDAQNFCIGITFNSRSCG